MFVITGEEIKTTFYLEREYKMTKKFTQEQYKNIIKIWEREISYIEATKAIINYMVNENLPYSMTNDALALANPLTREWAHEKFVEKEPEFHFILKDTRDSKDWQYHLVRNGRGAVILYPFSDNDKSVFKESEIVKWGFNPKMFDREEVK